jgi:mRNA interferase RelE/StbE
VKLIFAPQAAKALTKMPKQDAAALARKLSDFASDPFGRLPWAKALKGGGVRVRHGDWRAICEIYRDRMVVLVVKIGNRKDIYE